MNTEHEAPAKVEEPKRTGNRRERRAYAALILRFQCMLKRNALRRKVQREARKLKAAKKALRALERRVYSPS